MQWTKINISGTNRKATSLYKSRNNQLRYNIIPSGIAQSEERKSAGWRSATQCLSGSVSWEEHAWDTMLQPRRSQVLDPMRWMILINLSNHSGSTMPQFTQPLAEMSTRRWKIMFLWGSAAIGALTSSPPSMSRLSRQYGIFNISMSYRLPRPLMGIPLLFYI
jgi:hypothetical protein